MIGEDESTDLMALILMSSRCPPNEDGACSSDEKLSKVPRCRLEDCTGAATDLPLVEEAVETAELDGKTYAIREHRLWTHKSDLLGVRGFPGSIEPEQ